MNHYWSYYLLATGLFTGDVYRGSQAGALANLPAGCGVAPGKFDYLSQRIDLTVPWDLNDDPPPVIDYVPAAPPDTELETFRWDARLRRHVGTPTLAANKAVRVARLKLQIGQLEAAQARPLRELVLAVAASQAPAPGTKATLQAVEDAVLPLRQKVAAILAAASQAELDAIP